MDAEIICIGTELLLGHIVNTNTSFIAEKLAAAGIDHYFQTTVGDNPARLADTIRTGLERSDVVITTGGLGPTVDDITTRMIADVINKKLILEKGVIRDINDYFKRLDKKIPKSSLRQALIPEGAKWLKNPFGTAPGLIVEHKSKIIIALPGPPREMQPMVMNYVMPYLRKKADAAGIIKSRSIRLIGLAEASVDEKVTDLLNLSGAVRVGIYAKQREVELKVMVKAKNERFADAEIAKIEKIIRKRFGGYIYGVDKETLADKVVNMLIKGKKTIAVAESCTGGLIANMVTDVPGASNTFIEGIVSYSNGSKSRDLGVRPEVLKKYGAVSPQVAGEMAGGIRKRAAADIGLGVTGIAGPDGATKTKPVGLVYIALSTGRKVLCHQLKFSGSRAEIKYQASQAALDMLRCELL